MRCCCIFRLYEHLATLRHNVRFSTSASGTWKMKSPRSFATSGATHLAVCCYCHHFIWFWNRTVLGSKHTFCLHTFVVTNIYFCMVAMFVIVDIRVASVSPNHIFVMVILLSPSNWKINNFRTAILLFYTWKMCVIKVLEVSKVFYRMSF